MSCAVDHESSFITSGPGHTRKEVSQLMKMFALIVWTNRENSDKLEHVGR